MILAIEGVLNVLKIRSLEKNEYYEEMEKAKLAFGVGVRNGGEVAVRSEPEGGGG